MKVLILALLTLSATASFAATKPAPQPDPEDPKPTGPAIVSCTVGETLGDKTASQTLTLRNNDDFDVKFKLFPKLHAELDVMIEGQNITAIDAWVNDDGISGAQNNGEATIANLSGYEHLDLQFKVGETVDHAVRILCTKI